MTYRSSNRCNGSTCARDEETIKERNLIYDKLRIRPDHPRGRIEIKFWMMGSLQRAGGSYKCQVSSESVKGFRKCGGRNLPPSNGFYNRTSRLYGL